MIFVRAPRKSKKKKPEGERIMLKRLTVCEAPWNTQKGSTVKGEKSVVEPLGGMRVVGAVHEE